MTNVSRELLRDKFGDGRWRTIDDMAYALQSVIPAELAGRTAAKTPGLASLPINERLHRGRRVLVRRTVLQMVGDGQAERQSSGRDASFRLKGSATLVRVGRRLPPATFTTPAPGTRTGFTRAMLYQLVTDSPNISLETLVARLDKCFRDAECVKIAESSNDYQRKKNRAATSPTARTQVPPVTVAAARLHCVRRLLQDMKTAGQVTLTTVTTVTAVAAGAES